MATDVILQNYGEGEESRHGDQVQSDEQLKEKQLASSQKFQRFNSLDIESRSNSDHRRHSKVCLKQILLLAFFTYHRFLI